MTETKDEFKIGINYFKTRQYEKALSIFQKEIQENPSNILAYFLIGKIFFNKKKYDLSLNFFEISYNNIKNEQTVSNYGKNLIFNKQYLKAIDILEKYENIENKFYLSIAYYNINHIEKAYNYIVQCEKKYNKHHLFKKIYTLILYKFGSNLLVNGKYDEAIQIYENIVSYNKSFYKGFFQLGLIFIEKKDYLKSTSIFEKIKKFYDSKIINIILLYLYNKLDQKDKIAYLLKNNNLANSMISNDDFEKILAFTLIRSNKYSEAIPLLIRLHKKSIYDENILYYLAISRELTNDLEKAKNCYKKILGITEKNLSINNSYILFLLKNNQFEEGYSIAKNFIEKEIYDNKTLLYYFYSAILSKNTINFEQYIEYLKNHFDNNAIFLEATGKYYKDIKNDYILASDYLYRLYNMQDHDNWTLLELCDIFSKKDMKNHALFYLNRIYEKERNNCEIVYLYGKILLYYGEIDKSFDTINNLENQDYRTLFLISKIYYIKNNKQESINYLKKSLNQNPIYYESLFFLTKIYYKNNQFSKAINLIRVIERLNLNDYNFCKIQMIKSLIYFKLYNYEESLKILVRLHKRNKYRSYMIMNGIKILLFYNHQYDRLKKLIQSSKHKFDKHINCVLLLMIFKKEFNLEKIEILENELTTKYSNFQISKDYFERYKKLNTKKRERFDLGLRIDFS